MGKAEDKTVIGELKVAPSEYGNSKRRKNSKK